jgi:hypothetical protein
MNGESLTFQLNNLLSEISGSQWVNQRTSYSYLYEGARKFAARVKSLTANDTIYTVANQTAYDLNSDFANLYFRDSRNNLVIKYADSSNNVTWIPYRNYDAIQQADNTEPGDVANFSISDQKTLNDRITGTASASNSVSSLFESTLNGSGFGTATVGDDVNNLTSGARGIIIEKVSNSALVTALFDSSGATDTLGWTSGDAYVIVPQGLKQLILDPPPSASSDVITIEYLQEPPPVYSPYRTYRFDQQYEMAIVYYAAWLYKYRDGKMDQGDRWFKSWDTMCRNATKEANKQLGRNTFRVNMMKRSFRDRSWR